MTLEQRLKNWGEWSKVATGKPKGLPHSSPMFAGAKASDLQAGYGDPEAAPDEPRPHIFEADAQLMQDTISGLSPTQQAALKHEYVSPVFTVQKGRRDQQERVDYLVADAKSALLDALGDHKTGKPKVLELIELGFSLSVIAEAANVSRQYAWRVKKGRA